MKVKLPIIEVAMAVVLVLSVAAVFTIALAGGGHSKSQLESSLFLTRYGKTQYYENGRTQFDRSRWLWVGGLLAREFEMDLSSPLHDQAYAELVEIDSTINGDGLGQHPDEFGDWFLVHNAVGNEQGRQVQLADIEAKRCNAISAASIKPDGTVTTNPVEIVC